MLARSKGGWGYFTHLLSLSCYSFNIKRNWFCVRFQFSCLSVAFWCPLLLILYFSQPHSCKIMKVLEHKHDVFFLVSIKYELHSSFSQLFHNVSDDWRMRHDVVIVGRNLPCCFELHGVIPIVPWLASFVIFPSRFFPSLCFFFLSN